MKKITFDWFISLKKLGRDNNTFGSTFYINGLRTKISFLINGPGYAMVFILQGEELENKVLLGIVRTEDETREIYNSLTRGEILS